MIEQTFDLVIHFIALVFLTEILDSFEEGIEAATKKDIPDWFGFLIVWVAAYFVVWVGDWRFLHFLGYESVYTWGIWVEWGLSSLIIAAGSSRLEKKFDLINTIPAIITNIRTSRRTTSSSSTSTRTETEFETEIEPGDDFLNEIESGENFSTGILPYSYGPDDPKI